MATTTNLNSLVINYLTQAQYDEAAANNTLNENQLYLTPTGITAADISNWNGKSDTDEKLTTNTNYSLNYSYKFIFGAASSSPSTKFYSQNLEYSESDSTATIRLGGSTKLAQLMLESGNNHTITLYPDSNMTSNPYIQLPDKTGTIALTSDVSKTQLIRWTEV